jgi:hypothetical protein
MQIGQVELANKAFSFKISSLSFYPEDIFFTFFRENFRNFLIHFQNFQNLIQILISAPQKTPWLRLCVWHKFMFHGFLASTQGFV